MVVSESLSEGNVRLRIDPWRGRSDVAELTCSPAGGLVPPHVIGRALERARDRGYRRVVTPALPEREWDPYLRAGLQLRERLHLLIHDLLDIPERVPVTLRPVRRRHRDAVLDVDALAFPPFWRLDRTALDAAARATPAIRFRAVPGADAVGPSLGRPLAYALWGRAGDRGYLQRLAVDPDVRRQGMATALVVDGLRWLSNGRVREALVNTQAANEGALALYESIGFRRRADGLGVLQVDW